ncbi:MULTISPECIES: DUF378 domain-containing protein [Peptostreptococcaceae]
MWNKLALILVIIGALNWGCVAVFSTDVVGLLFGGTYSVFSRIIFGLVAIAGIFLIPSLFSNKNVD